MTDDVGSMLELLTAAATFKSAAIHSLLLRSTLHDIAFLVPFLAGVSEMTGQSATLALNRVPRLRIVASLVVTGLVYTFTALVWTLISGVIAILFSPPSISFGVMSAVICISFAPRILGILTIAPYYGEFLGRLLDAWMIAIAAFGVHLAFDLPAAAAALVSVSGWTLWVLLRNAADRFLRPVLRLIEEAITGRPLTLSYTTVDDLIRERVARNHDGPGDD